MLFLVVVIGAFFDTLLKIHHDITREKLSVRGFVPKFLCLCGALSQLAAKPIEPWPEFLPTEMILLSKELFEAPYNGLQLQDAIKKAKVGVLKISADGPLSHTHIWLRDFAPQWANRGEIAFDFNFSDPPPSLGDQFPTKLAKFYKASARKIQIELDGGNFQTNGDTCFTSVMNEDLAPRIKDEFKKIGCRQVIVFKNPPHVHLDMWMKVVSESTILISELDEKTLQVASAWFGGVPEDIKQIKHRLDQIAADLSLSFNVQRIPLPVPYRGTFRNYANSVLVNGTVIIPAYAKYGWGREDYPDTLLNSYYEEKVRKAYTEAGFQVVFINADGLIYNGGAWHCVTAHIPRRGKD